MHHHNDENVQIAIKIGDRIYIMERANIIRAAFKQEREHTFTRSRDGAITGNHASPSEFTFNLTLQGDNVTVQAANLFEEDHARAGRPALPAQLPQAPATIELPSPGVVVGDD